MAEIKNPFKIATETETAAHFGLSFWTIRRFRLNEGLPHINMGARIYYRIAAVEEWFAAREQVGAGETVESGATGVIRAIRA